MLNNIKKTISYARRNGAFDTFAAAAERLRDQRAEDYDYEPPSEEALEKQGKWYRSLLNDPSKSKLLPFISILVPCYNTDPAFLSEMIRSVRNQTYGRWELILAEAPVIVDKGKDKIRRYPLTKIIEKYASGDGRIRYIRLKSNSGISENTNAALDAAKGDYIALLDHDDMLTKDALCEVALVAIRNYPKVIYSDEDKCDAEGKRFFQCHKKPAFNPDMFLSNNYMCHLTVVRSDVMFRLRLRKEYDGAQDYDLFLRAVGDTMWSADASKQIIHIPRVLYHWRSHDESTSANPASKSYAYEAGKRAVQDFITSCGMKGEVSDLKHVGFYRVNYEGDIFSQRKDLGVVGGRILDARGTLVGGNYRENGRIKFENLPRGFSGGFQHRAVLQQDTDAVDVRCMKIRDELRPLYAEVFGVPYSDTTDAKGASAAFPWEEETIREKSVAFGNLVRQRGYRVMWDPEYATVI